MKKQYQKKQKKPLMAEEPKPLYDIKKDSESISHNEGIAKKTVSVDEFFDELISLVRSDYANL